MAAIAQRAAGYELFVRNFLRDAARDTLYERLRGKVLADDGGKVCFG